MQKGLARREVSKAGLTMIYPIIHKISYFENKITTKSGITALYFSV